MKKHILLVILACAPQLLASTDATFTAMIQEKQHEQAALNSKNRYIIGCDANVLDVTTGLFQVVGKQLKLVLEVSSKTKDITDFTDYFVHILNYIEKKHSISVKLVCIATPGNTSANKDYIKFSHLAFAIDGRAIQVQAKLDRVFVINDFEVVGFGIQALDQKHIITLKSGKPRANGTKLIIGAGNGLGSGLMLWDEKLKYYVPSPISYSFVDFCARTEQELEFGEYLQKEIGSRSWGKVLGAAGGIKRMYAFLSKMKIEDVPYEHYQEVFAQRSTDACCQMAVDFYMKLYARLVRNAAYAQLPYNGVYIMNGVAEKNPELFKDPAFMREVFQTDNEYLTNYLLEVPFYLVDHSNLYMHGAALYALVYESTK